MKPTQKNSGARQSDWVQSVAACPPSAQELASVLAEAASAGQTIELSGLGTKHLMGGPVTAADVSVSTAALNRTLQYEPHDLTISVEAGMRWADLQTLLAQEGQTVALDPPFADGATVGGVVASNSSGPFRKMFGTARDLVIGMQFATLEGKLVRAGGMVVKNVAGLDIGKLMIGSFGTLAAITSVNFRLHLRPEEMRSYFFADSQIETAMARRDRILTSHLRPLALDLLSPAASAHFGRSGYCLALRAGGSSALLARYSRELPDAEVLTGVEEAQFWQGVREFSSQQLKDNPDLVVLRASTRLAELANVQTASLMPCISRAGNGVSYIYCDAWDAAVPFCSVAAERGWTAVVEFAPDSVRAAETLWLPGSGESEAGFDMMKNVKRLFDSHALLNRSRLYGRI